MTAELKGLGLIEGELRLMQCCLTEEEQEEYFLLRHEAALLSVPWYGYFFLVVKENIRAESRFSGVAAGHIQRATTHDVTIDSQLVRLIFTESEIEMARATEVK